MSAQAAGWRETQGPAGLLPDAGVGGGVQLGLSCTLGCHRLGPASSEREAKGYGIGSPGRTTLPAKQRPVQGSGNCRHTCRETAGSPAGHQHWGGGDFRGEPRQTARPAACGAPKSQLVQGQGVAPIHHKHLQTETEQGLHRIPSQILPNQGRSLGCLAVVTRPPRTLGPCPRVSGEKLLPATSWPQHQLLCFPPSPPPCTLPSRSLHCALQRILSKVKPWPFAQYLSPGCPQSHSSSEGAATPSWPAAFY